MAAALTVFAGCATKNPTGVDPVAMLDARLSSLEAQLQESRAAQERLAGVLEVMTERAKKPALPQKRAPRGKMRKTSKLPIQKLTPEGEVAESEGEETAETVVDSRHEGLHLYGQGLQFLRDRKFDEAIERFRRFLKENPDHVYADRAQYLIAEAHYGNKEYGLVIVASQLLETKYPYSFRLPEAGYYRAMALLNMGQRPQAAETLKEILKRFPKEPIAETASRKLAELSVTRRSREDVPLLPEMGT
jgi:TolA-binding protein